MAARKSISEKFPATECSYRRAPWRGRRGANDMSKTDKPQLAIDKLNTDQCRRMLIALGKHGCISADKHIMRRTIKALVGEPQ
jgi:hypothetical protein